MIHSLILRYAHFPVVFKFSLFQRQCISKYSFNELPSIQSLQNEGYLQKGDKNLEPVILSLKDNHNKSLVDFLKSILPKENFTEIFYDPQGNTGLKKRFFSAIILEHQSLFLSCQKSNLNSLLFSILALKQHAHHLNWKEFSQFSQWVLDKYVLGSPYQFHYEAIEVLLCECIYFTFPKNKVSKELIWSKKNLFLIYTSFMSMKTIPNVFCFFICKTHDLVSSMQLYQEIKGKPRIIWNKEYFDPWLEWLICSSLFSFFPRVLVVRESTFIANFLKFIAEFNPSSSILPTYVTTIKPWISLVSKGILKDIKIEDILKLLPSILFSPSIINNIVISTVVDFDNSQYYSTVRILFPIILSQALFESINSLTQLDVYFSILKGKINSYGVCPYKLTKFLNLSAAILPVNQNLAYFVDFIENLWCCLCEKAYPNSSPPLDFLSFNLFLRDLIKFLFIHGQYGSIVVIFRTSYRKFPASEMHLFLANNFVYNCLLKSAIRVNAFDLIFLLLKAQPIPPTIDFIKTYFRIASKYINVQYFLSDEMEVSSLLLEPLNRSDRRIIKKLLSNSQNVKVKQVRHQILACTTLSAHLRKRLAIPQPWQDKHLEFLQFF